MDSRLSQPVHSVPLEETQDEISLERIFATLWGYRKVIEVGIAIVMGVYVVLALAGFMLLPRERLASIGFRLVFDGVDDSKYPNNTNFATSDIIATPVLAEVYAKDDLSRYTETFEKFKNSIFIRDANRDLELLDLEYSGRLSDQKLAPVDRARIETEYKDKRKGMAAPFYSLTLRRNEWITAMPKAMAEKVLKDTLSVWAEHVDSRKGALKYNIQMYTRASVPLDLVEHEDYLIAADVLRAKTLAALETVDMMARLPGAGALRAGPEHLSLGEIRAGLNDTFRFRLQPLIATITQTGASTDSRRLRVYVEDQLAQAKERQAEAQRRVETYQRSLASYTGEKTFTMPVPVTAGQQPRGTVNDQGSSVIPQVSDSFLDRIMDLSRQNTDTKYRQQMTEKIIEEGLTTSAMGRDIPHYQELLQRLPAGGSSAAESTAIRAATKGVYDQVTKAIDQINTFYAELSAQNLFAQSSLYTITDPFLDYSQRALAPPMILMYGLLTFLLALFLVPLGCLLHHATVGRKRQK
jgi:hypothetical protein